VWILQLEHVEGLEYELGHCARREEILAALGVTETRKVLMTGNPTTDRQN
jgi:hypothetical protein